jgi:hypothetical protein
MPNVTVDQKTFNALTLAHAAITFARHALPYGSANQSADLLAKRDGSGPSGAQALPRLGYCRDGVKGMMALPHGALPPHFGSTDDARSRTYRSALSAAVALYYGTGNCGEHGNLTYHFLATFGYPGLTIIYASSTVMDHAYTVLTWTGCTDPVVCDAWPSKPQACLWSQFFANPKRTQPDVGYKTVISHNVTTDNMGTDLIGDAFRLLSPAFVNKLPPASRVTGYSQQQIQTLLDSEPKGIYTQISTLAKAYQPVVDFVYNGQLLSTVAVPQERWSATVEKVIVEVNEQVRVLDPSHRYTTAARG